MTELGRVYKLTVIGAPDLAAIRAGRATLSDGLETITEISELDIKFKIEKHRRKEPNRGELILYNLAPTSRNAFERGQIRVRLDAGYDDQPRLLFLGDVRYAFPEHDRVDWTLKLQLGDGARAFAEARVNRSYAKGTSVATILGDIAKAFGTPLPAEALADERLRVRISADEMLAGYAADELTRILLEYGFEWSFQNGRLQVLRFDAAVPGTARVISQDDGMIGSPSIEPPKITAASTHPTKTPRVPKLTVKHTLYPELIPGEKIELRSRAIRGTYIIDKLTHEGDTRGDDWTTTIEALAA